METFSDLTDQSVAGVKLCKLKDSVERVWFRK